MQVRHSRVALPDRFAIAANCTPAKIVTPLVAPARDASLFWLTFFSQEPGRSFQLHAQLIGNSAPLAPVWPGCGMTLSAHPQGTALFGYSAVADASDGSLAVVFCDARLGTENENVVAYALSAAGEALWGTDGVQLSANDDYEPQPRLAQLPLSGHYAFVWARHGVHASSLRLARISPSARASLTPLDGLELFSMAAPAKPGMVALVACAHADRDAVLVSYVDDMSRAGRKRLLVQLFDAHAGQAMWKSPLVVYEAHPLPPGYQPLALADSGSGGGGGVVLAWFAATDAGVFRSYVARVRLDGSHVCATAAAAVGPTEASVSQLEPQVRVSLRNGDLLLAWRTLSRSQAESGVAAARLAAADCSVVWATTLKPVGPNNIDSVQAEYAPRADALLVSWLGAPNDQSTSASKRLLTVAQLDGVTGAVRSHVVGAPGEMMNVRTVPVASPPGKGGAGTDRAYSSDASGDALRVAWQDRARPGLLELAETARSSHSLDDDEQE